MEGSRVTFCSATRWLVPYTRCQKYHWVPPGNRTRDLTALLLLIIVFYIITDEVTTLFWNSKADSSWHCNGLCAWCLGTHVISKIWKADGKAELPPAKNGQGYDRHLDTNFFHVDQKMWMVLTVVYIRERIPYASFSPEEGEEGNEIYVVTGLKKSDKLQCV